MITINLLPPEEKQLIALWQINRRIIFFGINILIALLIFIILLSTIYFVINTKAKNAEANFKNLQTKLRMEGFQDLQTKIKQTNQQLKNLDKIQNEHKYYSQILSKIIEIISAPSQAPTDYDARVFIKTISINQNQTTIEGFAANRASVSAIKQSLEQSPDFAKLESPLSNFIKPFNIDFRFTFVIKPPLK